MSKPFLQISERTNVKTLENLDCARDAFRDLHERWNDRLVGERDATAENYRRGRIALIVHLKFPRSLDFESVGVLSEVGLPVSGENVTVLVLKADTGELHYLENWNEQLVLVHDVHVVQSPQGPIPSLVGLYDINDKIAQPDNARVVDQFLLFQSAIYGTYKVLPLILDWKPRVLVGHASCDSIKDAVVQDIQCAAHVVQSVPDNERGVAGGELSGVFDRNTVAPFVFLNSDGVKIGTGKIGNELVQIVDVLYGPFNLFP